MTSKNHSKDPRKNVRAIMMTCNKEPFCRYNVQQDPGRKWSGSKFMFVVGEDRTTLYVFLGR